MGLVFSIQTRGGATESAQDNRVSTQIIHQGWQSGTVKICVLRTSHLEPYRTYVQFLKRTVPLLKRRTVQYFLLKI